MRRQNGKLDLERKISECLAATDDAKKQTLADNVVAEIRNLRKQTRHSLLLQRTDPNRR